MTAVASTVALVLVIIELSCAAVAPNEPIVMVKLSALSDVSPIKLFVPSSPESTALVETTAVKTEPDPVVDTMLLI